MVFHWSLSDGKSCQLSRTYLSIIADLSSALVKIVLIFPLISLSFNLLPKPLWIIPSAPTTIGITIIFMFLRFFFIHIQIFINAFPLFYFLSVICSYGKIHLMTNPFLLLIRIIKIKCLKICRSYFLGQFLVCVHTILSKITIKCYFNQGDIYKLVLEK